MEDKALTILRTMFGRRDLDTKTERIVSEDLERVNMYTIGNVLVIFSQKDKGLVERDIRNFIAFAEANGYKNGLVIVALSAPSENVLKVVKSFAKEKVRFFHIRQLQFDITTHRMAVPHRILKEEEKTVLFKKFKIVNPAEQLPSIDSQDAMVKWIGAVPGDVLEITRHSDVGGSVSYWRYCVEDVNVA